EHHGPVALGACIPAERGPLPINPKVARIFGVQSAFTVSQPADKCPARFLSVHIAVRQSPLAPSPFYDPGELVAHPIEQTVAGIHDLLGGKPRMGRLRNFLSRNRTGGRDEMQTKGTTEENAHGSFLPGTRVTVCIRK